MNKRKFLKLCGLSTLGFIFNPFSFSKKKSDINNIPISTKNLGSIWTRELNGDVRLVYGDDFDFMKKPEKLDEILDCLINCEE